MRVLLRSQTRKNRFNTRAPSLCVNATISGTSRYFSVSPMNYREVPEMVAFTHKLGARVLNLFFLVCTGRGEEMTDITPPQYEEVLTYLVDVQQQYPDMLVRARCAPHFKRIAYERDPNSPITKATGYMGGGCLAGTNYARVTPEGNLTPCPYMPLSAGNVREVSFVDLWERPEGFDSFREPKRSEEHTSELQSLTNLVCRLLLEKKNLT